MDTTTPTTPAAQLGTLYTLTPHAGDGWDGSPLAARGYVQHMDAGAGTGWASLMLELAEAGWEPVTLAVTPTQARNLARCLTALADAAEREDS